MNRTAPQKSSSGCRTPSAVSRFRRSAIYRAASAAGAPGRWAPLLIVGIVLAVAGVTGCGQQGPCASPYDGVWSNSDASLDFGADCSFKQTGTDGCQSIGSYQGALEPSGWATLVSISSTTGGRCLQATTTPDTVNDCGYGLTSKPGQLHWVCGPSDEYYSR